MTRHIHFTEYEYYSPILDDDVCRISVADEHGQEFFAIVGVNGKGYRQRRDEAIDVILQAIQQGCAPGQVIVT